MSATDQGLDLDTAGSGGAKFMETSAPSLSMLARVNLAYLWRHRRPLDLHNPRRFTELVQWRKLHDRDPRLPLHEVGDRPRFGEMTFYPGSGLDPFDPPELDLIMGALWLGGCTARDQS